MDAIKFEEANKVYKAPLDWDEAKQGKCHDLHTFEGQDPNGTNVIISAWQPTEADKQRIAKGLPIYLQVVGTVQPPVCIFTENAWGNAQSLIDNRLILDVMPDLPNTNQRLYNCLRMFFWTKEDCKLGKVTVEMVTTINKLQFLKQRNVGMKMVEELEELLLKLAK